MSTSSEATEGSYDGLLKRTRAPFKIGVCMEFAGGTQIIQDFYDGIRMMCAEAQERGELDRPVELIIREVMGPMRGTNPVVLDAWRELAYEEHCLAIIGPVVTEANMAIVDEVNRSGVPTISFCATFDWAGPYAFALQNGGFPDEAVLLAAHMAKQGISRVGVFSEEGLIGEEFLAAFRAAARRYGISIVSDQVVGLFNTQQPVDPQLEAMRTADAQAVLALTAYGALPPVQAAIARMRENPDLDWDPQCYQNMTWVGMTAFARAGDYDYERVVAENEGWIGLDQIHEGNQTFQDALDRFEQRYGRRPFHVYTALGLDHGMVVADCLARMKPPSPEGFRDALERLRMREACVGAPGTVISFGPHDNRGYKGDYIVFRTVSNGEEQLVDTSWKDVLQVEPLKIGTEDAEMGGRALSGSGSRYALAGERTPHRVGLLMDWALWAPVKVWYRGLEMAFAEAYENGVVDRPIEIVLREVEGPPEGDAADVVAAYHDLVNNEKVLAVVGPFITDMCMIMRDVVEAAKVPTVSYTATSLFNGDFCFQLPNGTFADETYLVARNLVRAGATRVGIIREDNPIGDEYYAYFRQHARRLGLGIASDQIVSPRVTRDEMRAAFDAIRQSGADGIQHIGYGLAFPEALAVMREQRQAGWNVPHHTITTWVMISGITEKLGSPELMGVTLDLDELEGWVGVDLPHEGNQVFQKFLDRYVARFGGEKPFNCYPAHYYDMGRFIAEGISRARPVTPVGLQRALENVRMLPATMGGPGTVISAGARDHRCYKGADYLVLRTVQDGEEFAL